MGVATIMAARKIYLLAWGDDKADIIKKAVEDKVSDTLPASYLQMHNNANVCIDLAAASPYPYPTSVAGNQLRMERQIDSQLLYVQNRFETDQQRLQ